MSDERLLVCHRLSDMATPHVKSVAAPCDLCSAPVWVALSSPRVDKLWCRQCAAKGMDENDEFQPLSEEQLEDVLDYLHRKGAS